MGAGTAGQAGPVLWLVRRVLIGRLGPLRPSRGVSLTPSRARQAGHVVSGARCCAIGLRFTNAAAQLACRVALALPMYRLLRAP